MCTWLVRQRCTTLPQAGVNILCNRLKAYNYFFKQIIFLNSTWNTFQEYCGVLKFIYQFCSGQAVCPSCPDFWAQAFEGNCPNNDRIIVIPCKALFMRFCPDLALILLDFVQNLPGFGLFFSANWARIENWAHCSRSNFLGQITPNWFNYIHPGIVYPNTMRHSIAQQLICCHMWGYLILAAMAWAMGAIAIFSICISLFLPSLPTYFSLTPSQQQRRLQCSNG